MADEQILRAQNATYALLDSQAHLRSQRQLLSEYATSFRAQEEVQGRRRDAAEVALQRLEEQRVELEREIQEAKDALEKLRTEAAAVEHSRRLCASQLVELSEKGQTEQESMKKELERLEERLKEVSASNGIRKVQVQQAEMECHKMKGIAHGRSHARAMAEDQHRSAQQEWELRDQVLMSKVHAIVLKLERSCVLQQVVDRSRREKIQHLLNDCYQVASAPKFLHMPNPFGEAESDANSVVGQDR